MSGNALFVHKDEMVAFSDYYVKDNCTLVKMSIENMIILEDSSIFIPMSVDSLSFIHLSDNGRGDDIMKNVGAYSVSLTCRKDINLFSYSCGELEILSQRSEQGTFCVRSGDWGLEVAAMTGCLIYDDVGKIFEEAYYSNGKTPPPYYVGKMDQIAKALSDIQCMVYLALDFVNKEKKSQEKVVSIPNLDDITSSCQRMNERYTVPDHYKLDVKSLIDHPRLQREIRVMTSKSMMLIRKNSLEEVNSSQG